MATSELQTIEGRGGLIVPTPPGQDVTTRTVYDFLFSLYHLNRAQDDTFPDSENAALSIPGSASQPLAIIRAIKAYDPMEAASNRDRALATQRCDEQARHSPYFGNPAYPAGKRTYEIVTADSSKVAPLQPFIKATRTYYAGAGAAFYDANATVELSWKGRTDWDTDLKKVTRRRTEHAKDQFLGSIIGETVLLLTQR